MSNPKNPRYQIEMIGIETLIPYARNSRTHSDAQIAQIAGSIREFGFTNPILIDAKSGIIAGHGRVLAARKLDLPEVPCIRLAHLTDAQRRAYVIADNKLALNAGWDEEFLKLELESLQEEIKFDLLGFTEDELSNFFKDKEANDNLKNKSKEVKIRSIFEVIAECEHEDEQRMIYNILNEKGIKCRLSTL